MSPKGYGQFSSRDTKHRAIQVHRLTYRDAIGDVPRGLVLNHLCRVHACCNPRHVEPVTQRVNVLRGEGLPAINARKTHCPQGHELSTSNTYVEQGAYGPKRKCATCQRARQTAKRGSVAPVQRACSICRAYGHRRERCPQKACA